MNASVYVFGNLGNGYTQYPDDYAKEIYQNFFAKSTAPSQITIRRESNLMYYGYIRKLDVSSQYIGFCILLNGVMFSQIGNLFPIFENTVTDLVARGEILHFNNRGIVTSSIANLNEKQHEIERIASVLQSQISELQSNTRKLPPLSYGTSSNESKYFSETDKSEEIASASCKYGYTIIQKSRNYETTSLTSYRSVIANLNKEKESLKKECSQLKTLNSSLKNKQRNMLWVGLLSVVVAVLGVILYFKVINPSEVTHYNTGEYIYYGPMKNKRPNGVGVAFYPSDDKDGRKYYMGRFVDGKREDTEAFLFYQDGDYYYGAMNGDELTDGMLYMNSNNSHFVGRFRNNEPYTGTWYSHEKYYSIEKGVNIYNQ